MDEFIAKPVRKKVLIEKLAGCSATPASGTPMPTPDDGVATATPAAADPPAEVALADVVPVLDRTALDTFIEEIEPTACARRWTSSWRRRSSGSR